MNLTEDSILSFTPDHNWIAIVTWTCDEPPAPVVMPVIGWAVVVGAPDPRDDRVSTMLDAVILDKGRPRPISDWLYAYCNWDLRIERKTS